MDGVLRRPLLLDLLLALVALIDDFVGKGSVIGHGEAIWQGARFSEAGWYGVFGPKFIHVLGQSRLLTARLGRWRCTHTVGGDEVFTDGLLFHGEYVADASICPLLQDLLLLA